MRWLQQDSTGRLPHTQDRRGTFERLMTACLGEHECSLWVATPKLRRSTNVRWAWLKNKCRWLDQSITYFLTATRTPAQLEFPTIVRNLSGEARRQVLNLPPKEQTPRGTFRELQQEYRDTSGADPFAAFYARVQRNGESAQSFVIALESLLRKIEVEHPHSIAPYQRDGVLATQFTKGLKDEELKTQTGTHET